VSDDKKSPGLPYYIPGASGIVLDAALWELAHGDQPGVLTVRKFKVNGRYSFSITMKMDEEPPE